MSQAKSWSQPFGTGFVGQSLAFKQHSERHQDLTRSPLVSCSFKMPAGKVHRSIRGINPVIGDILTVYLPAFDDFLLGLLFQLNADNLLIVRLSPDPALTPSTELDWTCHCSVCGISKALKTSSKLRHALLRQLGTRTSTSLTTFSTNHNFRFARTRVSDMRYFIFLNLLY